MKYYSTNKKAPIADLHKAVVKGLAEDRGLYMPEIIKKLPQDFFDNIEKLSFQEIAYKVADAFFGEDVDAESLKKIVYDTLAFDCPVVEVEPNIYSLELFHGPTLLDADRPRCYRTMALDRVAAVGLHIKDVVETIDARCGKTVGEESNQTRQQSICMQQGAAKEQR